MIDQIQVRTIALVAAVVMAGAGLNLAVLGLDSDNQGDQLATLGDDESNQLDATGEIPTEPPVKTDITSIPLPQAETQGVGTPLAPPSTVGNDDATATQPDTGGSTNPSQGAETAPAGSGTQNTTAGTAAPQNSTAATSPAPPGSAATTNPPAPAPTPTAAPTTAAPTAAPVEYKTFEFRGVASEIVVAVYDGKTLEFWSVKVEPGWQYQVEKAKGREIKIEFRRGPDGDEAKFVIKSENGRLTTEQEK